MRYIFPFQITPEMLLPCYRRILPWFALLLDVLPACYRW